MCLSNRMKFPTILVLYTTVTVLYVGKLFVVKLFSLLSKARKPRHPNVIFDSMGVCIIRICSPYTLNCD